MGTWGGKWHQDSHPPYPRFPGFPTEAARVVCAKPLRRDVQEAAQYLPKGCSRKNSPFIFFHFNGAVCSNASFLEHFCLTNSSVIQGKLYTQRSSNTSFGRTLLGSNFGGLLLERTFWSAHNTFAKVCPLLGRKSYIHHQFVSRYGSHLYRDTFAEALGSGVVGTFPTTLDSRAFPTEAARVVCAKPFRRDGGCPYGASQNLGNRILHS